MNQFVWSRDSVGTIVSFGVLLFFIIWQETNPDLLESLSHEDGPIETLSAILFGLSSVCFFVFAWRSDFLRNKPRMIYLMTISWALLMFIFMGEEISWGQRIFNTTTPDWMKEINVQEETNLHNIAFIDSFMGGKYRYLSIMMITTGLLLPLLALSDLGKRFIQKIAFPVSPMCYAPLFIGAYIFGKYYGIIVGHSAAEVRELLMSIAMFCFAFSGVLHPCALFRICESKS